MRSCYSLLLFASSTLAASLTTTHDTPFPFSPGFDIESVADIAEALPSHSWEFGTASEALLELYSPDVSVFGKCPFPVPKLDSSKVKGLAYAESKIVLGTGVNSLSDGDGAVGDPASLGVSAVLLGKTNVSYATAAKQTVDYIINDAPRFWNGAISHRADVAELWADFIYMAPPFLAYYAVDTKNTSLLQSVVELCAQYRQVLQANITGSSEGVWEHIIGPQSADLGLWSTGNAWAAAGMTRVLATILKAPIAAEKPWKVKAVQRLTCYIKEIVDGARSSPADDGLLRNYLNDTTTGHGYGEISGTTLLASAVYRMAVLQPETFGSSYIRWAEDVRKTLGNGEHVSKNGTLYPAVNPLAWGDLTPYTAGSPEGNNFGVLMYAAWRDCKEVGVCS